MMRPGLDVGWAMLVLVLLLAVRASAQSYAGDWQAGATSMDVVIASWGTDCGPRPSSTRSAGGGRVRIEQEAQVLIIYAGERRVRSDACWSPNPAMRRVGTNYTSGLWTTRCKTPAEDPRQESGTYTLKTLAEGRLLYQDVSHFNWKLEQSVCEATITTTQTLLRQAPTPTAPTVPGPAGGPSTARASGPQATAPAPNTTTCTPGPAKRIQLRPKQSEIQLGQQVCFEVRVLDAADCELTDASPRLRLQHRKGIKARLQKRCFLAGASSAESEGTFTLVASHGKLQSSAEVVVVAASLPSLLTQRLQAVAVEGEPVDAEAPTQPTADAVQPRPPATRLAARAVTPAQPSRARGWLLVTALVLALGVAVAYLLVRARARTPPPPDTPAAPKRRCPKCGARFPLDHTFCGNDGSALEGPN